jgi:hypothetical protein
MKISGILAQVVGPGHVLSNTSASALVRTASLKSAPISLEPVEAVPPPIDSDDENDDPMFEF